MSAARTTSPSQAWGAMRSLQTDPYSQQPRYVSSRRSSSSSTSSSSQARCIARPYSLVDTAQGLTGYAAQSAESGAREEVLWSQSDLHAMSLGEGSSHAEVQSSSSRPNPVSHVSKGKEKATTRPATMYQAGETRRKEFKSDWIVDDEQSIIGADAWVERDRVILVLGRATPDSLSPLLYNPQYAQTLILIALSTPLPAFVQLAAQKTSERTTYPVIQLIDMPSTTKGDPSQSLMTVLQKASGMSYQWRASLRPPPPSRMSWMGGASRRSSTDSMASSLLPVTPPMSHRGSMSAPQIYSRRSSETSNASQPDSTVPIVAAAGKRMSTTSSHRVDNVPRPPVTNRKSSLFGLGKNGGTSDPKLAPPSSPFDAVVHIVPPASDHAPNRALQEMLQSSVLLTSAVAPMLARRSANPKSSAVDSLPISLVHVIEPNSPQALPPVIENFVLSLLPKFQIMCDRRISGYVVNQAAWLYPAERETMSGGDLLLFGGARVRPITMPDGTQRTRKRAYIPYWPHQGPPMTVAPNPDFTRPDYSTMVPLAPPAPDKPAVPGAPRRKSTTPRSPPGPSRPTTKHHHRSGLSQSILPSDLDDAASLHTPDLDHAPSSASSQSHEAATPHASTYGSELSSPTLTMDESSSNNGSALKYPVPVSAAVGHDKKSEKERSGFGSFVKRFGKKR